LFDEEEEGRRAKEEDDWECREGVAVVPSRLLMLYKLLNSCLCEVREWKVEEKRSSKIGSAVLTSTRLTDSERLARGIRTTTSTHSILPRSSNPSHFLPLLLIERTTSNASRTFPPPLETIRACLSSSYTCRATSRLFCLLATPTSRLPLPPLLILVLCSPHPWPLSAIPPPPAYNTPSLVLLA
jgi:hypothetical protein